MNVMYACTVECRQRLPPHAGVDQTCEICLTCRRRHSYAKIGLPHAQWHTKDHVDVLCYIEHSLEFPDHTDVFCTQLDLMHCRLIRSAWIDLPPALWHTKGNQAP